MTIIGIIFFRHVATDQTGEDEEDDRHRTEEDVPRAFIDRQRNEQRRRAREEHRLDLEDQKNNFIIEPIFTSNV